MDKNRNVKEDIHRERVILKKEGRHVKVSGAYTKRELRKLLYSSTSILQSDDESRTKRSLKSDIKLSQVDLDKIKEDKIEEISKKDKRILPKDLHVTIDVIRNVPRKNKEKVKNILLRDDKRKRINEKSLREHLRDIGLSDSLIKALLTNGFTDEYIREEEKRKTVTLDNPIVCSMNIL